MWARMMSNCWLDIASFGCHSPFKKGRKEKKEKSVILYEFQSHRLGTSSCSTSTYSYYALSSLFLMVAGGANLIFRDMGGCCAYGINLHVYFSDYVSV